MYNFVLDAFYKSGLSQATLARRMGVDPAQITRWFRTPSNWEQDTVSNLIFAICGGEPRYELDFPLRQAARNDTQPTWVTSYENPGTRCISSGSALQTGTSHVTEISLSNWGTTAVAPPQLFNAQNAISGIRVVRLGESGVKIISPRTPTGYTLFCDDVRMEANGKSILIGLYSGHMYIYGDLPIVLPKLCFRIVYLERPGESDDPLEICIFLPGCSNRSPTMRVPITREQLTALTLPPPPEDGEIFIARDSPI